MKVKIKDIAEYCHVSEGTVDRALHNRFGIREETRQKIIAAAEELGYTPDHIARSLATGLSMTIGVVCFDLRNNFFPELIDTIEMRAKEKGYFIHLVLTHKDFKNEEEGLRFLLSRNVDGIILFPIGVGKEYVSRLKKLDIPVITIYNKISNDFTLLGVDDVDAMRDAVTYIYDKGYEQILYVTPSIHWQEKDGRNVYILKQRMKGFKKGVEAVGASYGEVFQEGLGPAEIDKMVSRIRSHEKTAILCECDSYALQVMECLEKKGLTTPNDYGLMGYDNLEMLEYIHPRLTTIKYSVAKMGNLAFDCLYDEIQGDSEKKTHLLPYEIVEGETIRDQK